MNKTLYIFLCTVIFLGVSSYTFYSIKDSMTAKDSDLIGNKFENKDYTMEISDKKITVSSKNKISSNEEHQYIGVEQIYLEKGLNIDYDEFIERTKEIEKVEHSIEKIETEGDVYILVLDNDLKIKLIKQDSGIISDVDGNIFLKKSK